MNINFINIFNNITLTKMSENIHIINIPENFISCDIKRNPEYIFQTNIEEGHDIEMGFPKDMKPLSTVTNPIIKLLNNIFYFYNKN